MSRNVSTGDVVPVLKIARDLISKPGSYLKGMRTNYHGAYCALGALDEARNTLHLCGGSNCDPGIVALESAIPADDSAKITSGEMKDGYNLGFAQMSPHNRTARIACYNNATDQKTVVAWFDRAIRIQQEHPMEKAGWSIASFSKWRKS